MNAEFGIVLAVVIFGCLAWILVGPGARRAEKACWEHERMVRHRIGREMVRQWKVRQLGRKR